MAHLQYIPQSCRKEKKNNIYQPRSNNTSTIQHSISRFTTPNHVDVEIIEMGLLINTNCKDERQIEAFRTSDSNPYPTDTSYICGGTVGCGATLQAQHLTTFAAERTEPNIKLTRGFFPLHPCGFYGDAPNVWTLLAMDSSSFPSHPCYELSPVNKPASAASDNHNTMETELLFSGCFPRTCKLNFTREHEKVPAFILISW